MIPEIAVAVSGGIDSLVAAFLLKKQFGRQIIGVHFLTGYAPPCKDLSSAFSSPQPSEADTASPRPRVFDPPESHPIQRIAAQLDIPIRLVDCRSLFQKEIVDYFIRSYQAGETPNPCVVCNQKIKFGMVMETLREMGIPLFATGHYAGITCDKGLAHIRRGKDPVKDQSYFLAFLQPGRLPFVRLPLGDLTKRQTIELARDHDLKPISVKESQDICFVPDNDYSAFIANQPGFSAQGGDIVDTAGKVIGSHDGLHQFTIGQRRGINCPASEPYYVTGIDVAGGRLTVGFKKHVFKSECNIRGINWFVHPPSSPMEVRVQIRYRHHPAEAWLVPGTSENAARLRFKEPQASVTPGQAAVFYVNDEVIAGGWIHE